MLRKPSLHGALQLPFLRVNAAPHPYSSPNQRHASTNAKDLNLTWPTTPTFTPYDLLHLDHHAPYTKTRYYDLVKIYHPDRPAAANHPLLENLTPELRIQRYHLLVAAHELLSDPAKRAAYDQFGTGWTCHPHSEPKRHEDIPPWARPGGSRDYNYHPISANATWEDWERWRNRHQPRQQHAVDNRTFVAFLVLLTLLGGALQASWIGRLSSGVEERLWEVTQMEERFLAGRREKSVAFAAQQQQQQQEGPQGQGRKRAGLEEKVQRFLLDRDPSGVGLKGEEVEVYRRIFGRDKGKVGEDGGVGSSVEGGVADPPAVDTAGAATTVAVSPAGATDKAVEHGQVQDESSGRGSAKSEPAPAT
ncbi:J domain-containing protein [Aspergillus saccharolyticus JOP 1030-1]|uniref:J domain-containing protein n=1 Tax=Aspergillus saccharolyticus JOP 1030-1 TaxID=1450539 RepID=A0A318ZKR5_9EURO|nr:hypothetical protein BP01DRAFT_360960 [Aspergillus saccharolyticus JOP 1030-1]PYH40828.1 hypothetical protein BP01DRAFT_360960 [Aspergillus saccharolyticus JOP 1030-1]